MRNLNYTLFNTLYKENRRRKFLGGNNGGLLSFRFAVDTAVCFRLAVGELENVVQLLLGRSYTARIFALYNVRQRFGHGDAFLFGKHSVFDDIDRCIGVNKAYDIEVDGDIGVYLNYVFSSHFFTCNILDYRNRNIERIETEKLIKTHSAARRDMVDNDAVGYGVNVHIVPASFNSFKMSAIRIYFPLRTCLK